MKRCPWRFEKKRDPKDAVWLQYTAQWNKQQYWQTLKEFFYINNQKKLLTRKLLLQSHKQRIQCQHTSADCHVWSVFMLRTSYQMLVSSPWFNKNDLLDPSATRLKLSLTSSSGRTKQKYKFLYAFKIYTIDYKSANEILAKTLKYLHRNNTHTK